LCARR